MIRKRRLGYHSCEWDSERGILTIASPTASPLTLSAVETYTLLRWLWGLLDEVQAASRREEEGEGKP